MTYTRRELEELVERGENAHLELKTGVSTAVVEALAAMANGEGGVLVVGASDRGELLGMLRNDGAKLVEQISLWLTNRVEPPLTARIDLVDLENDRVAVVVDVAADALLHVLRDGRMLVRVGAQTRPMTSSQILAIGRKSGVLPPFDTLPVFGATRSDLAPEHVDRFVVASSPDFLRSLESVLQSFSLLVPPAFPSTANSLVPSLAGLLLLGRSPQQFLPHAVVRVIRHAGSTPLTPVIAAEEIGGTVPEQIDRFASVLARFTRTAANVEGLTRRESAEYPPEAIQQLVVNSVVHRDYGTGTGPVVVRLFSDRIEIANPGRTTALTFDELTVRPASPPNPTLERGLRVLGYVEALGVGLARATARLRTNRHGAPVLEQRGNHVVLIVHAAHPSSNDIAVESQLARVLEKATAQTTITRREVRDFLGVSEATALRYLRELVGRGLLTPHAKGRGAYYTRSADRAVV
jgi:ATP-dependent DNA helicase RecG